MVRADLLDTGSGYLIQPRALESETVRAYRATATDRPAWILFLPAPRRYVVRVLARDGTPGNARLLECRAIGVGGVAIRKTDNNQLNSSNGNTTDSQNLQTKRQEKRHEDLQTHDEFGRYGGLHLPSWACR